MILTLCNRNVLVSKLIVYIRSKIPPQILTVLTVQVPAYVFLPIVSETADHLSAKFQMLPTDVAPTRNISFAEATNSLVRENDS